LLMPATPRHFVALFCCVTAFLRYADFSRALFRRLSCVAIHDAAACAAIFFLCHIILCFAFSAVYQYGDVG